MRTLVVFEDLESRAFDVLTDLRSVFDLRCGAGTLLERLTDRFAHDRLVLLPRPELCDLVAEMHPDVQVGWSADAGDAARTERHRAAASGDGQAASAFVFVNGRLLVTGDDAAALDTLARRACGVDGRADAAASAGALTVGNAIVVAHCDATTAQELATALDRVWKRGADAKALQRPFSKRVHSLETLAGAAPDDSVLLEHAWELVQHNQAAILDDFAHGPGAGVSVGARIDPGVHLMHDASIRVEEGVRLRPGVVLDAEGGPITLEAGVDVQPLVVLRGPLWVGRDCLLKAGAKIHEGTSLGPVCKVGGEVEGSILQAYSNKQHEGFLGHAFLGEWVNLGADTNNSDLKNNYGSVRMWESGRFVDTDSMFMGLVAADHVKSAINTQFNTGTVVGLSSQVFGAGFPPKYIAPFTWGTADEVYELERALETARAVMARRQRELTPAYEAAFRRAFDRAGTARNTSRTAP